MSDANLYESACINSDLERDKAFLNLSFALFVGLLAFIKEISGNQIALIFGMLAIATSALCIYYSTKVLRSNRMNAEYGLHRAFPQPSLFKADKPEETNKFLNETKAMRDIVLKEHERNSKLSMLCFFGALLFSLLCALSVSGITINLTSQNNSQTEQVAK